MMICYCGQKIADWETMCRRCWNIAINYDEKFLTNFASMAVLHFQRLGRRDYLTKEMIELFSERLTSDHFRQMEKLRLRLKQICKECVVTKGKEIEFETCFQCPWHIFLNMMRKELNGHS